MKKTFDIITIILMAVCPIIGVYSRNYGVYSLDEYFTAIMGMITFIIIAYSLLLVSTKKHDKSILYCYSFLFTVWYFEDVDNILDGIIPHASKIALLIIILIFTASIYLINKFYKNFANSLKFVPIIVVIFYGSYVINISQEEYHAQVHEPNLQIPQTQKIEIQKIKNKELPNIYYIVVDGYARNDVLKKLFNYDNSLFTDYLNYKKFNVNTSSFTNYGLTFLSLASTLNMTYLDHLRSTESKDRTIPIEMMKKNYVCSFLQNIGYKVAMVGDISWTSSIYENADIFYNNTECFSEVNLSIIRKTLLQPFYKIYFTNSSSIHMYKLHAFDFIANQAINQVPTFVYAHIVMPHPPFLFNSRGEYTTEGELGSLGNKDVNKKAYIEQLQFLNSKITQMINKIIDQSKIPPVILIQSDHGTATIAFKEKLPTSKNSDKYYDILHERWANFTALYLQGKKDLQLPITNINIFPYIFNTILEHNFEMLPDKIIYSDYDTPYDFLDVTDDLLIRFK